MKLDFPILRVRSLEKYDVELGVQIMKITPDINAILKDVSGRREGPPGSVISQLARQEEHKYVRRS